jgi:hypothetical protein
LCNLGDYSSLRESFINTFEIEQNIINGEEGTLPLYQIGTIDLGKRAFHKSAKLRPVSASVVECFEEVGKITYPPTQYSSARIVKSLQYARGTKTRPRPGGERGERANQQTKEASAQPTFKEEEHHLFSDRHASSHRRYFRGAVEDALRTIPPKSAPGCFVNTLGSNNQLVLDDNRKVVVDAVVDRLELLFSDNEFPEDPWERVKGGWFDPVMPFEKFEGHPERKAALNRWRIVTCMSLIDQLVERILYNDFVEPVKEDFPNSGVVIGIGFTDMQGKEFAESVAREGLLSTDISGMDRSLDASYPRACIARRCDALPSVGFDRYRRAMHRQNECTLDPVFAVLTFGRAELYVSPEPKGMLSGRFVTTYFNSEMRTDMAFLTGASFVRACGDDCLEFHEDPSDIPAKYRDLGFTVRDPVVLDERHIEFCSHSYDKGNDWKPALTSWPKAMHRLCTRTINQVHVDAFYYEVRNNMNLLEMRHALEEPGVLHLA